MWWVLMSSHDSPTTADNKVVVYALFSYPPTRDLQGKDARGPPVLQTLQSDLKGPRVLQADRVQSQRTVSLWNLPREGGPAEEFPGHVTGVLAVEGGAPQREATSSSEPQPDGHTASTTPARSREGVKAGDHYTGPSQRQNSIRDGRDRGGAPCLLPGESNSCGGEEQNMTHASESNCVFVCFKHLSMSSMTFNIVIIAIVSPLLK